MTLKHRNLSGLKQRLDEESMGIAAVSSGVGRTSLSEGTGFFLLQAVRMSVCSAGL